MTNTQKKTCIIEGIEFERYPMDLSNETLRDATSGDLRVLLACIIRNKIMFGRAFGKSGCEDEGLERQCERLDADREWVAGYLGRAIAYELDNNERGLPND